MNNNFNFQFGMYEPTTDSIIVNTGQNSILVISCKDAIPQSSLTNQVIVSIFIVWQRILRLHTPSLHYRQMACRIMWML